MARKKSDTSGGGGGSEWLNTYADMVTLLLTFFILLFSMSTLDSAKFNLMVKAFSNSSDFTDKIVINGEPAGSQQEGAPLPDNVADSDLLEIFAALKQYIEDQSLSDSVKVSQGEGYVFIQFMDDMLFEPNSSELKTSNRGILRFVGNGIKSVEDKCEMISIHGFTATVPNDPNYPVNEWLLSSGRANAMLVYFDDEIGIDKEKMTATTWGMNKPIADNDTVEGRAKNRRVEILISTESSISEQLDNIYEKLVE